MTTPAPLLEAVGQIAVRVHDLQRAKAFYRDVLQLKLAIEAPGLLFFEVGGLLLMLSRPERTEFDHPSSIIYFRTPDIDAACRALTARGVKFDDAPHVVHRDGARQLWMVLFHDSEDNPLILMQWKQAGLDGSVTEPHS
jgi:methylmalonyl-CoA/ethylmalonyl-CoA epimerase